MPLSLYGVVPFGVILIVLFILMAKENSFQFLKFYFTIVSIAGVIGMVIAFGNALYQYANRQMVSDDEYIAGSHQFYEIQSCEQSGVTPRPVPNGQQATTGERTEAEIAACKEKTKTRILNQRDFNKKEGIISGLVRGALFSLLFITHFPFMIRKNKE